MIRLIEIDCTKQAEQYFLSSKDNWTDADFPDLRPLDNNFTLLFILPEKIRMNGKLLSYPMAGTKVLGTFTAEKVHIGQQVNELTSPVDGWYVWGEFVFEPFRFAVYYFCNNAGVIHNPWSDKSKVGTFLKLNPEEEYSHDQGFRDLATMMVQICCLAISQEQGQSKIVTQQKPDATQQKQNEKQPWERPKQILRDIGRQWPDAWQTFKMLRAGRGKDLPDWPDWCYIPIAAGFSFASENVYDQKFSPAVLTAAASWRVSQGVYRFDAELYNTLVNQPVIGNVPCEVLTKLPEWCVFIETIGASFQGLPIVGFWTHLESDANNGRMELRFIFMLEDGRNLPFSVHLGDWSLEEGINRMQAEVNKNIGFETRKQTDSLRKDIMPMLQLVLYLCAENMDIPEPPVHPLKRAAISGRIDSPKEPRMWMVGQRIGAALRTYRNEEAQANGEGKSHAGPRPHMRRTHWHHFWRGPKVGQRDLVLHWMPPMPINVIYENDLPVTLKVIKNKDDDISR